MCSQGLAQHLRSNKVVFPNFEEACKIYLSGLLESPAPAPALVPAALCSLWHVPVQPATVASSQNHAESPCHVTAVSRLHHRPHGPEPAPPPPSPGSHIQRPKAALPDDLGQGHSAPYSIHSRLSFVPVGNCPWEELKQRWLGSRSPAQAIPASIFRGRETYFISYPSEDSMEEWRR
jgi:hypothetical protein